MTLVPFGFSHIRSGEPTREVSDVLPTLESEGAEMLRLEEVIVDELEAKGRVQVEKVVEHVLTCFRSHLLGFDSARTSHGDRGSSQGECLGGHQDHGCMVPELAGRRIGLPFQSLYLPRLFAACVCANFVIDTCCLM
jgi:hypothetical protein